MSVARETEDLVRDLVRHHHDHPPVRDLNREEDRRETQASRAAGDAIRMVGTWAFIAAQVVIAATWIILNAAGVHRWDAYPFGLLDLVLSGEALLVVVLVLIALNRSYTRERLRAQQAFEQEVKLEEEIKALMTHLERQDDLLVEVLQRLDHGDRELRRLQRRLGADL